LKLIEVLDQSYAGFQNCLGKTGPYKSISSSLIIANGANSSGGSKEQDVGKLLNQKFLDFIEI